MKTVCFGTVILLTLAFTACDLSGDGDETAGEPLLPGEQHYAFGSVTDWMIVNARLGVELSAVDSSGQTVASLSDKSFGPGNAHTVIAAGTPTTGRNLTVHTDWQEASGLAAGGYGLRLYNTLATTVSVYDPIDLAGTLSVAGSTDYVSVTFGVADTTFFVLGPDGEAEESRMDPSNEPAAAAADVLLLNDSHDSSLVAQWFALDPPTDLDSTGAAVRVINASASQPQVDVDFPGSTSDVGDLSFGEATAETGDQFYVAEIAAAATSSFQVSIGLTGAADIDHLVEDAVRGDIYTLILWDSSPGVPEILALEGFGIPEAGTDVAIRVTNLSDSTAGFMQQSPLPLATTQAGQSSPSAPGAIARVVTDTRFIVRTGGAWLLSSEFTPGEDQILSLFAVPDETGGVGLIGAVRDVPETSPLGDQFALVRFVNVSLPETSLRVEVSSE